MFSLDHRNLEFGFLAASSYLQQSKISYTYKQKVPCTPPSPTSLCFEGTVNIMAFSERCIMLRLMRTSMRHTNNARTIFPAAMPGHLFSRCNRSCGSFSQSMVSPYVFYFGFNSLKQKQFCGSKQHSKY